MTSAPAATRAIPAIALAAGLVGGAPRSGRACSRIALAAALSATLSAAPTFATPLDTLVAAERAFAALSEERGLKEAFLTYLAADGVVFHPGPVNGRQFWRPREKPAAALSWAPDYAEVSGDGDLGVTSGPWEYRPAPGRNLPTAYGHFISVWRRPEDGAWRVAADMGVEHERLTVDLDAVEPMAGPEHPKPRPLPREFHLLWDGYGFGFAGGPGYVPLADRLMARAINDMTKAERDLVFITRNQGFERAYAAYAAADVRVYRNGTPPVVGRSEALGALAGRGRRVEIAPQGHGMSSSRDLGYGYGLLITRASGAAKPDTASYLHVWRLDENGFWKLALDVETEFSRRR